MRKPYKIETYSDQAADDIHNIIRQHGGDSLVEGWAVVTDFKFDVGSDELQAVQDKVSKMRPIEELSHGDVFLFNSICGWR